MSINSTQQDESIADVNSMSSVGQEPKLTDDVYSENMLMTSPSSDQSSNLLDIVSWGGLSAKSLFSVSQSAGLSFGGTPGDVTVTITGPPEESGDPVTVQLSALFQVVTLAGQNYQATVTDDVHYSYNNGPPVSLLRAAGQDLERGESDSGSPPPFEAKIGDSFTLHFSDVVSGKSVAPFGFNYVYYKTDLSLNISVKTQSPDLLVSSPSWAADGGVDFSYSIQGASLSQPTTVGLYWATNSNPSLDPAADKLAFSTSTQTAQSQNSYPLHVSSADFVSAPPKGYGYLKAVINPDKSVQESDAGNDTNDVGSLLPDIEMHSLTWHPDTDLQWANNPNAGGVDFTYTVHGAILAQGAPLTLYWTDGSKPDCDKLSASIRFGDDFAPLKVASADGTYTVHVPAAQLGIPQPGDKDVTNLLVLADPTDSGNPLGTVLESDEGNNYASLGASKNDILVDSVSIYPNASGPGTPAPGEIDALFRPAHGALRLSQAAAIFKVDHFNWIQYIVLPEYVKEYINYGTKDQIELPNRGFDPSSSVEDQSQITVYSAYSGKSGRLKPRTLDDLPYYWNEPSGVVQYERFTNNPATANELEFYDGPRYPTGFLKSGDKLAFSTYLAGVSSSSPDEPVILSDYPGTMFGWTTNAQFNDVTVSGNVYFQAIDDGTLPPISSGGVSDVHYLIPPSLVTIADQTVTFGTRSPRSHSRPTPIQAKGSPTASTPAHLPVPPSIPRPAPSRGPSRPQNRSASIP